MKKYIQDKIFQLKLVQIMELIVNQIINDLIILILHKIKIILKLINKIKYLKRLKLNSQMYKD